MAIGAVSVPAVSTDLAVDAGKDFVLNAFFFPLLCFTWLFGTEQQHAELLAKRRSCRKVMRSFRGSTYLTA